MAKLSKKNQKIANGIAYIFELVLMFIAYFLLLPSTIGLKATIGIFIIQCAILSEISRNLRH